MTFGLRFLSISLRNFLSFGSKETIVRLDGNMMTVILGMNMDTGGEDSRNGVGKSAIIDAISYALFGKPVRQKVTIPKLVNKQTRKGQPMMVVIEFEKDDLVYRLERGENPSRIRYYIKAIDNNESILAREGSKFKYEKSKSKKEVTNDIEELLGFDHDLFVYLIALSSETDDYLWLKEADQRKINEKLFGFEIMAKKAKLLSDDRRIKNRILATLEGSLSATRAANKRIQTEIDSIQLRSSAWEAEHEKDLFDLDEVIQSLSKVDVKSEMELLKLKDELVAMVSEASTKMKGMASKSELHNQAVNQCVAEIGRSEKDLELISYQLKELNDSTCPTCKQHWEPDPQFRLDLEIKSGNLLDKLEVATAKLPLEEDHLSDARSDMANAVVQESGLKTHLSEIESNGDLTYNSVEEAAGAEATLLALREQLESLKTDANPHIKSVERLETKALEKIDDSEYKESKRLVDHYDLLIELLTKKDSYVRRHIIEQWLPYLNGRIAHWLTILELPHSVHFQSDMSVEIMKFHEDYDYGNLSKGERNRLRIALSLSFQEVFQYMNYPINLICVDEMIDNGICPRGAENAVAALREISQTQGKRVLLVTHREDIAANVEDVMLVVKENDISRIEYSNEINDLDLDELF